MRKPKSKSIFIDFIANTLPVDTVFNRVQFCRLVGMSESCSKTRLPALVKGKFLTEHGTQRPKKYTMSYAQKERMLMRAYENTLKNIAKGNKRHGVKYKTKVDTRIVCPVIAEFTAYVEKCNRLLFSAKLV